MVSAPKGERLNSKVQLILYIGARSFIREKVRIGEPSAAGIAL